MDRVLEIGGFAAGYCGRMFVQAGCEVVHVAGASLAPSEHSSAALDAYLHAGKRRIQTDDLTIIGELAGRADVIVAEAPTAQGLLDVGFDDWQAPVKAAITPFGRTGPKKNWSATPSTLLAMAGYTYLMGDPDRAPLTLPGHYAEFQSGGFAYLAANASRLAGEENVIDVGMFEIGYGVEPVHDGVVDLRGRDTFPPRQRLPLRIAEQPVSLRGRLGLYQRHPAFLGRPCHGR